MHLGSNQDPGPVSFPSILHYDQSTRREKIAFVGTDLSKYPITLPDSEAEFILPEGKTFNFGGGLEQEIAIDLTALAQFFPETRKTID